MSNINEIRDAALVSCEGIRDALGLIHAARVRDAARKSMNGIEQALTVLAEFADETGLEDKMLDHPDFISRSHLEREVDYSTVELYGDNYVKVQDLYDLFKAPDSNQAELYNELS